MCTIIFYVNLKKGNFGDFQGVALVEKGGDFKAFGEPAGLRWLERNLFKYPGF